MPTRALQDGGGEGVVDQDRHRTGLRDHSGDVDQVEGGVARVSRMTKPVRAVTAEATSSARAKLTSVPNSPVARMWSEPP